MKINRRTLALGAAALALPGLARAQGAETIKLGFTAALTGPFNEFGEGIRRGAELAVAEASIGQVASSAARWNWPRCWTISWCRTARCRTCAGSWTTRTSSA